MEVSALAMASLYVRDLHPDVTEDMLGHLFRPFGTIHSICVEDRITKRFPLNAFVNFHHPADTKKALEALSSETLSGRRLRITWSHSDGKLGDRGCRNIIVKGLEESIDSQALYDVFCTFGKVLYCKVDRDDENGAKGYAFVQFEAPEDAGKAIKRLDGLLFNEDNISVGPFNGEVKRGWEVKAGLPAKLRDVTSTGVQQEANVTPPRPREPMMKTATKQTSVQLRAKVTPPRPSERRQTASNQTNVTNSHLYIKNLGEQVDEEYLRKEFSPFGSVIRAGVVREHGRSRGFGFVTMSCPAEASRAIAGLNGRIVACRPVLVALVKPKKQVELNNWRRQRMAVRHAI